MKRILKERLPSFTEDEKQIINGTNDYFGLNHYTSRFVRYGISMKEGYEQDTQGIQSITDINGRPIGSNGTPEWLIIYPEGIRKVLNWINNRCNIPFKDR
jgi:beta-glucosidase